MSTESFVVENNIKKEEMLDEKIEGVSEEKPSLETFLHHHFYTLVFLLFLILLVALIFINGMAIYNRDLFVS